MGQKCIKCIPFALLSCHISGVLAKKYLQISLFKVSHEFFLNLSDSPYCDGIEGILAAYHNSLINVQLYGPTNFAPVIRHVARFAQAGVAQFAK